MLKKILRYDYDFDIFFIHFYKFILFLMMLILTLLYKFNYPIYIMYNVTISGKILPYYMIVIKVIKLLNS